MHTTLISTTTLAADGAESWAIIDCRADLQTLSWGRDQYAAGHIPSAVYADLATDLSAPMTGSNGRHPWPSTEAMVETFSRLGIGPGTQVVAYDQDAGMFAARLWWMLRVMGHEAVAVLDGGFAKWVGEGRPVTSGAESRRRAAFVAHPRPELVVDAAAVAAVLASGDALLVDARAPERFEGRSETLDRVAGHIPGAVNRFFKENLGPDGTFRPAVALRADLQRVIGGRTPDQTIMYCGSGVTACHNLLALEHAGLTGSRLYAGSWSEWCADPARPVETGR
jgi:thiosulfate/3-mercaptopyruvate sulfurtransferase